MTIETCPEPDRRGSAQLPLLCYKSVLSPVERIAVNSHALAWLMLSVATLGASTLFAILVASSRAPATAHLLPGHDFFHLALVLHVTLGPTLWFLAFSMVLWNLVLPTKAWNGFGWIAFALATLGAIVVVLVPAGGTPASTDDIFLSNYIPVLRSPLFLVGLALFASGFALSLVRILRWLRPNRLPLPERALGWGLLAAALASITAIGSVIWSAVTLPENLSPAAFYEMLFWGPGHIFQSMHVLLMMVAWLVLAKAADIPLRSSVITQRVLFLLASLPVLLAPLVHLAYAPESTEFRGAFTDLMRWTIWPGMAFLAADILYGLAQCGRKGIRWTAATWALAFSIALLIIGLAIGMSISENNAVVPAHYHATTGAVTMAYLGVALALLPRMGFTIPIVRWPVLAYGIGTLLMAGALGWAGFAGMTRKVPGSEKVLEGYSPHLTVIAVGGTMVIVGGIGFVIIMLRGWLHASRAAAGTISTPWWRVRRVAIPLLIAGLITTWGIIFTLLPGQHTSGNSALNWLNNKFKKQTSAAVDPHADPEKHMQQARTAEINLRFQQATAMMHAKRYDLAVAPLQRLLTLDPRMPEAHVNMGFAMLELKNYDAARSSFETAIDLRPMQANAYYGLAEAMGGMNDMEGAIGAMRSYVHLSAPDDPYLSRARTFISKWESARGHKPGSDLPSVKTDRPKN